MIQTTEGKEERKRSIKIRFLVIISHKIRVYGVNMFTDSKEQL